MLEFKPCHGQHLKYIDVQEEQQQDFHVMLDGSWQKVIDEGFALSAWEGSTCLGAAGFLSVYPHRAMAWAVFSRHVRACHLRAIAHKVRSVLQFDPTERIEMTVRADFVQGRKFATLIGMQQETGILRKHGMRGEDEYMYARIK